MEEIISSQGTPQEWIDILKNYTTIPDCKEWWQNICNLRWTKEEAKQLRNAYIYYVRLLSAKKWRERPIDTALPKWLQEAAKQGQEKKFENNLFKGKDATKQLIRQGADENWFARNKTKLTALT